MASRWLKRATVSAAVAGLALIVGPGTAWAANLNSVSRASALAGITVKWTGNGTTHGVCDSFENDPDLMPGAGQQGWLFILTHPFDLSGSQLTFTFSPAAITSSPVTGNPTGGNYHFIVYTPLGATLLSASATNGTAQSNLTVSHCEAGTVQQPSAAIASEVHLPDHTVVDNANPATAPASVHDKVTLSVFGLPAWTGTLTLDFFTNGNCTGDVPQANMFFATWDQTTAMPQDGLFPQTGLAAGDYGYRESFHFTGPAGVPLPGDVLGACEPFKVVAPQTSPSPSPSVSPSPSLPTTGNSVGGVVVTGAVLLAAGAGMIAFLSVARRRRGAGESGTEQ